MRRFNWQVQEINEDGSVTLVTTGQGDEKTTAAVLRSLAEQLDPTRPVMRGPSIIPSRTPLQESGT